MPVYIIFIEHSNILNQILQIDIPSFIINEIEPVQEAIFLPRNLKCSRRKTYKYTKD